MAKYYIQNKGFCGGFLKFWRPDGHGYTLNLDEAWLVSEEEAKRICRSRPREDFPILAELAEAASQRCVNFELLRPLLEKNDAQTENQQTS